MSALDDLAPPAGGAGWYPDPFGSKHERYFDGASWTNRIKNPGEDPAAALGRGRPTFMDRVREAPMLVKIGVPILLVVLIAVSASGGHEGGKAEVTSAQAKKSAPPRPLTPKQRQEAVIRTNDRQAVALEESIKSAISTDDSPEVDCFEQTNCGVTYEIGELVGIDVEEELLDDQREVWPVMFADPKFQAGFIELEADAETVGGKTVVEPILRVRCNRAADRQIDWENVKAEGIKQLCRWEELAKF
jgi:hypothetical protein